MAMIAKRSVSWFGITLLFVAFGTTALVIPDAWLSEESIATRYSIALFEFGIAGLLAVTWYKVAREKKP
jgi:hypothetical protein